ncbi:MAG: Nramp family divalent metal transporter [Pirellulales bacterium]
MKPRKLIHIIGPGILVAATGVGAGDLATASFTGAELGLAILWAVLLGAFLKFVLNEGLTRWQLATGSTLVEGCVEHLGRPIAWLFLAYLAFWSFMVAAALMSAVGVTCHAIWPLAGTSVEAARTDKIVYGALHSLAAVALVRWGGYRLFEKVMAVCIAVMFVVVVTTAVALRPSPADVLSGLVVPAIPNLRSGGVAWTVALIGSIGGTVTLLCYGYWIREEQRHGPEDLQICRIDLATGYAMTALFGLAMVVIGSSLGELPGGGATLIVEIASKLEAAFGRAGTLARWAFLAGAWGAVVSSMLGVWQSIPYLFADLWQLLRGARPAPIDTGSRAYRGYLYAIATVPILGMAGGNFQAVQKAYAIVGAAFVPMLAAVLLLLNGRSDWVTARYKNSTATVIVLLATLLFFIAAAAEEIYAAFAGP